MRPKTKIRALFSGLTLASALAGCGDSADPNSPAGGKMTGTGPAVNPGAGGGPRSTSSPAAKADPGKGPGTPAPATGDAPKIIDQPAAPTPTPDGAAKEKDAAPKGEPKKETPPKGA